MKFLANMGISPVTVAFLRRLGHEAMHLHELGHDRMLDPDILSSFRSVYKIAILVYNVN